MICRLRSIIVYIFKSCLAAWFRSHLEEGLGCSHLIPKKERKKRKKKERLTLTLRTHSFYLSNKMCLSVCVSSVLPLPFFFLFKVNIS